MKKAELGYDSPSLACTQAPPQVREKLQSERDRLILNVREARRALKRARRELEKFDAQIALEYILPEGGEALRRFLK